MSEVRLYFYNCDASTVSHDVITMTVIIGLMGRPLIIPRSDLYSVIWRQYLLDLPKSILLQTENLSYLPVKIKGLVSDCKLLLSWMDLILSQEPKREQNVMCCRK